MIKEHMNKIVIKKIIFTIFIVCFMVKAISFLYLEEGIRGSEIESTIHELPSYITYELDYTRELSQTFIPRHGIIKEMTTVLLQTGEDMQGKLHIQFLNQKEQEIFHYEEELKNIKPGEWTTFEFNCTVPAKKVCKMRWYVENEDHPVSVLVVNSAFDTEENRQIFYQDQEIAGGLFYQFDYIETYSFVGKGLWCIAIFFVGIILLIKVNNQKLYAKMCGVIIKDGDLTRPVYWIGLCALTAVMYYVHVYRLSQVPCGINIDAMGMGYDAWCMANFGVDRYLKSFPVYLINFGGGQSALYMYITTILIKVFGYSEQLLRVPALLNAIIIVLFGSLIIRKKWNKRIQILLFVALYTIFPVFIMFTRIGLDCNLMLGASTAFLYFMITAVENQKITYFVLSGLAAGMTLYTYVISYLVIPLFLIILLFYLLLLKKIKMKQILAFSIPLFLLAFPLLMVQIINMFDLPEMKIGFVTIPRMLYYRSNELSFTHYWSNLYKTIVCIFMNDMWDYDSIPQFKNMYWFSVPFAIVGIIYTIYQVKKSIETKEWNFSTVLLAWFLCMILVGGMLDGGSGVTCYKVNASYFTVIYFVMEGLHCVYKRLYENSLGEEWLRSSVIVLGIAYFASFIGFTEYYYGEYVHDTYPNRLFNTTYKEALMACDMLDESIRNREVCIQMDGDEDIIYFCGSSLVSPYEFHYVDGIEQYENYTFVPGDQMEIDVNKIYILEKKNRNFAMELEKNGFFVEMVGTRFLCYAL